jgi:hypothetical protein
MSFFSRRYEQPIAGGLIFGTKATQSLNPIVRMPIIPNIRPLCSVLATDQHSAFQKKT